MDELLVFLSAALGLGTAIANGWVTLRRAQSDKVASTDMAKATDALNEVATSLSKRFAHAQNQMDRMLDLLARLVP